MKNKNLARLTSIGTMAMMLMPTAVFAAELNDPYVVDQTEAEAGTTRDTEVLYSASSTFSVTIPKTIVLDRDTKMSGYTVNVKGDISSDQQVSVAPQDALEDAEGVNFYMVDQSAATNKKDDVQANVTQNDTIWSSAEIAVADTGTTKTGNVDAPTITAGSWKGTFTFNIAMQDAE